MEKNKIIIGFLILVLIVVGFLTFNKEKDLKENSDTNINSEITNSDIKKIIYETDFSIIYNDLDKLVQNSETVIDGKVLSVEYLRINTLIRTISTIEVQKVYMGDIEEKNIITVIEEGGITTLEEHLENTQEKEFINSEEFNNIDLSSKIEISFNNTQTLKENDEVILFLSKGSVLNIDKEYYSLIGSYQGKFYKENSKILRKVSKEDVVEELVIDESELEKKTTNTTNDI